MYCDAFQLTASLYLVTVRRRRMNVVRRIVAFSIWTLPTLRGYLPTASEKTEPPSPLGPPQKNYLTHSFLHRPFYLIFSLNFYGEKKQRRWRCPRKLAPLSVPRDALSPFLMDDLSYPPSPWRPKKRNVIRGERCFFFLSLRMTFSFSPALLYRSCPRLKRADCFFFPPG